MTSDPGSGAPQPGGVGDVGVGGMAAAEGEPAADPNRPPLTGDGPVDSVLERMRGELAELAEDDLTGRRTVLAGADVELRVLLDSQPEPEPRSDPESQSYLEPRSEPHSDPDPAGAAGSPGFAAR